ncbi:uncharacterized protein LOC113279756 [Papaver somniferum]|uniref:uncharacterized protein LOC113279756 n=1 Tax=Papaver somniferum TaxID=3469 RepID=UPI000E6FAEBF|nr:uncharacterized protein LOC113279756 [Papaver somniferum]
MEAHVDFFSVGRGLRQGVPLSPILFVLMEDVLSINISALMEKGEMQPMVMKNGIHPTHLFFADDVFIFCNGGKKSLKNLFKLLDEYQVVSSQIINKNKSKLFVDGNSHIRRKLISNTIHMEVAKFPGKYFGVYLAPGKVTSAMVWHIVEVLQSKLAAWKGNLLSFHDRLVLVKSVLSILSIYNMSVYRRPSSVIKVCEKIIRNFLWTGDGDTRKFKTLSWKKVCTPYEEGVLGIKRLKVVNQSLLMKLMWRILNSDEEWAMFLSAKFQDRYGQWTSNWKQSTIWKGLKWAWNALKDDIRWKIGDVSHISVWFDIWLGENPLINDIGYTDFIKNNIGLKVNSLLSEGHWNIPIELQQYISNYKLPAVHGGVDIRL